MKKILLECLSMIMSLGIYAQIEGDSIRYNQYGVPVSRTALKAENRDGILVFESADQNYRFWFDVRVQIDGAVFFGKKNYMDPIGNGVNNRRSRLAIKAQITKDWYGEIDTDLSSGAFELKEAVIRYTGLEGIDINIGNFKEDFSMEQTTSSRYIPFIERSMAVNAFSPSRHLGADIRYDSKKWFHASAGIFFQTIDNLETATFVEDNNKDFGRNQGVSYTGKMYFTPLYNYKDMGLHLATGASYRTPKTDVATSEFGGVRYSTRNSTSINRKKYLDTDVIPNVDHTLLYNFELAGYYKGLRLQGEYIGNNVYIEKDAPANVNKDTKKFGGWYAMAGYLLFGGHQRYNSNEGEFTQPGRGRKWGDVELLLRYDYLNLNSRNIYGGSGENYTVGLNYYINKSVKFILNYQYSRDDRYANGKGKLNIGYDQAGNPTSNFKDVIDAKGKAGVRYNMLGVRFEIDF
jgi:phosphate-selective porin OprO/OprP